jgi:uncharacterized membrane protein (UPF0127 family)
MIPWPVLLRRAVLGILALAVAGAAAALPACKNSGGQRQIPSAAPAGVPSAAVVIDTGQRQVTFRVELARTEEERERGLMYREKLAADAGMLFLFERSMPQTFWMKNTLIPLDMIFLSPARVIVGVVANAEPLTLTARGVAEPSQYVLEIGGGLAARLGIRVGQRVELRGVE